MSGGSVSKLSLRDGGRGASPSPPELRPEEVAEVLRALGLYVDTESIAAIERLGSRAVRVVIARNGVAFEVAMVDEGGRWKRTPLYRMR